jgi:hypothetical protein
MRNHWSVWGAIALSLQTFGLSVHGQLVDVELLPASAVVQSSAVEPQDAPGPVTSQATPPQATPLGPPPVTPPESALDEVPEISEPFADPLLPPGDLPVPSPALGGPTRGPGVAGRGAVGLGLSASLGVTAGSFSTAPTMIGDLFGGGVSIVSAPKPVVFSFHSEGTILSGSGGTAELVFEFGGGTPDDIFTVGGSGVDLSGDGFIDQFDIFEPIPPTDAPTAPGPDFIFAGGEAVYTNSPTETGPVNGQFTNGEFWYVKYSYIADPLGNGAQNVLIAGPDVATRRTKLSENFSPEVRDRFFANYSFFNDAFGGLGDVSRYVVGFEKVLIDDLMSMEVRLPMAGTFSSRQQVDRPGERDFELGNATLVSKFVLLRSEQFTWTGGTGVTVPFADDARLLRGEDELLRIENEAVHLLPFTGLLYRFNPKTFVQAYTQFDFDMNGNPVLANLSGGPLQGIGRFTDSSLAHADVSAHRIVYENRRAASHLKGVIANAELHYTGTLQESDRVAGDGVVVTNLKDNFNVLNGTVGAHFLVGKHLVVTPAMSVPLRDGLDEQFDYEAILQLNYLH